MLTSWRAVAIGVDVLGLHIVRILVADDVFDRFVDGHVGVFVENDWVNIKNSDNGEFGEILVIFADRSVHGVFVGHLDETVGDEIADGHYFLFRCSRENVLVLLFFLLRY